MATKYLNPAESQSAHAVTKEGVLIATPDKLSFIVSCFADIDPATRKRIATAINIAGYNSMSSIPGFLAPIILYGLTQSFDKPWGYHPLHATPAVGCKAIADMSLDVEKRLDIAKVMLKHEDSSIREWAKLSISQANFSEAQLKELGLAPTVPATPANVPDPTELLRQTATELGLNPDAFVLAKQEGVSYADALVLIAPKSEAVATTPAKTSKPAKSAK